MNWPDAVVLVGLLVVAWIVQIVLSYRQAMRAGHRIAALRRSGTVAVGLGRGRLRSRTYAIVSVDQADRVVAAEVLHGWSSLSKPTPIPLLSGLPYEHLCDTPAVADFNPALRAALCQVVTTIRQARATPDPSEGGVAIA